MTYKVHAGQGLLVTSLHFKRLKKLSWISSRKIAVAFKLGRSFRKLAISFIVLLSSSASRAPRCASEAKGQFSVCFHSVSKHLTVLYALFRDLFQFSITKTSCMALAFSYSFQERSRILDHVPED